MRSHVTRERERGYGLATVNTIYLPYIQIDISQILEMQRSLFLILSLLLAAVSVDAWFDRFYSREFSKMPTSNAAKDWKYRGTILGDFG